MGKLLSIRQDIEMEKDEDGVFRPSRRVWTTTPDGRLHDGSGPTIIQRTIVLDDWRPPLRPDAPYDWTDFDRALELVDHLVAMCPDQVELLAEAGRRLVEEDE
jgi:hypothetical protein